MTPIFIFKAEMWLWKAEAAAWHFITVPQDISKDIQGFNEGPKRGFGSVRVKVTIGKTTWKTSIFPSKKDQAYILPIKKEIRTKENISLGDKIKISLELE